MNVPSTDSSVESSPLFIAFRTFPFMSMLVLSLLGNSLIIISFALNENNIRAKQPIDVFIVNLAVLGLLECLITQPISCGCAVEGSWIFGRFLVNLNSAFIEMKNIGVTLTISAIVVDRYVAITRGNETSCRVHYANYAILYSWMHSLAFALPLVFQSRLFEVTSRPFLERCLCGLTERTSLSFTLTLAFLCYGSPLIAIAVVLPLAFRKISLERRKGKGSIDSTIYNLVESRVAKETKYCRFAALLTVSYLIFVCPYLIMDFSTQLGFKSAYLPPPSNTTHTSQQVVTISYQTVLVWLMFLFSAAFPFITFYSFRDRWQNMGTTFKRNFLQSNQNSMRSIPRRAVHRQQIEQSNRRRRQQKRRPLRKSSLERRRRQVGDENSYAYKRKRNPTTTTTTTTTSDGASCSGISEIRKQISSQKSSFNVIGGARLRIPTLVPTVDGLKVQSHEETIITPQLYKSNSDKENVEELSGSCTVIELNCNEQKVGGTPRVRPQQMETRLHHYIPPKFSDEDGGYIGSDVEESDLNLSGNSTTLILPFSSKSLTKKDSSPIKSNHCKGETSGECSKHTSSPSPFPSQTYFVDMETHPKVTSSAYVTVEVASRSNKVNNSTEMKFVRPRRISAWSASLDGQLNSGGKHSLPPPTCRDVKDDT